MSVEAGRGEDGVYSGRNRREVYPGWYSLPRYSGGIPAFLLTLDETHVNAGNGCLMPVYGSLLTVIPLLLTVIPVSSCSTHSIGQV